MGNSFKWKNIPRTPLGFVNYQEIPSPVIRRMVADAERVKLEEEYKARVKWNMTLNNKRRIRLLKDQLGTVQSLLWNLERAGA